MYEINRISLKEDKATVSRMQNKNIQIFDKNRRNNWKSEGKKEKVEKHGQYKIEEWQNIRKEKWTWIYRIYSRASKESRRNKYKINEKKMKCTNGRVSKKLDAWIYRKNGSTILVSG